MDFKQFKFLSVATQIKMHLRMEFGSGIGPTIHTASTHIPDTLQYDQREKSIRLVGGLQVGGWLAGGLEVLLANNIYKWLYLTSRNL